MAFIQLGLTVYLVSLALSHIYDPTTYPDLNFDTNTAYVLNHTQTYEDGFTYFNYTVSELEEGLLHFKTNNPAAMATEQVTYFNNSGVESEDGLTYFDIRTNMHILKSSWFPELAKGKYVYYFGKGYDNFCWPREVPPSDPLPSLFRSSQLKPWVQVPIRAAVLLGIACRLFQSMLICSKRIYFSSGDKLHVYISRIFVTNELIHNVSLYLVTNFLVSPDQRYAPFFGLSLVSAFATFALKMLFSFWHSGLRRVTAVRVVLFFLVSHAILPTYNSCMAYLGHNYCDPYGSAAHWCISWITLTIITLALFTIAEIPSIFGRLTVTLMGALLTVYGQNNILLENPISVFLGNISFSIYLIHWPFYCLLRIYHYYGSHDFFCVMLFTIIIAAILHTWVEKRCLRWSTLRVIFTILGLGALAIVITAQLQKITPAQIKEARMQAKYYSDMSPAAAIKYNTQLDNLDIPLLAAEGCIRAGREPYNWQGFCTFEEHSASAGNATLMVIGNSWAANALTLIYEECSPYVKNISAYSVQGCDPLPDVINSCRIQPEFEEQVERIRPDILFIVARGQCYLQPFDQWLFMASTVPEEVTALQGFSVLSICLYNLWPQLFPNGLFGIDMYIVMCGYLLAHSFFEHPSLSISSIAIFYYNRAKYIFPLYFLALPIILVVSYLFIGIGWLESVDSFALYSLPFLKNVKSVWDREDYFNALLADNHTKDPFRHLWVICLEVQCNVVSPIAFLCLHVLKKRHLKIVCLLLICIASCCLYYISNSYWAYMCLPGRLWQFGLGAMAFVIVSNKRTRTEGGRVYLSTRAFYISFALISAAFLSLMCTLVAQEINEIVMGPLVTLSCFVLLIAQTLITKQIISCKIFTFFGDISFPLYLIHWPIILLFESKLSPQITIAAILILSILCHKYYEKVCRNLSVTKVLLLFSGLALLNLWVFLAILRCPTIRNSVNSYYYDKVPENLREALKDNLDFARDPAMQPSATRNSSSTMIHPSFTEYGIYDYPNSSGEKKVAILGDTYALNQMEIIYEEFEGNYSQFKAVIGLGLTGLYDKWEGGSDEGHQGQYEAAMKIIEYFKPDILFLISRHSARLPYMQPLERKESLAQTINKNIVRLEKSCGMIFIHGPLLYPPLGHLNHLIDAISTTGNFNKLNLNKMAVDRKIQRRQSLLDVIQCSKCEVYTTNFNFSNATYETYDPTTMRSYFDNSHHLTYVGLEMIRGTYFELISEALF